MQIAAANRDAYGDVTVWFEEMRLKVAAILVQHFHMLLFEIAAQHTLPSK